MPKFRSSLLGIFCSAGLSILLAQEDQQNKERREENLKIAAALPDGPGKTILVERCGDCHSLGRVTSGKKSLVSWRNTIQVMAANGAVFEDKEAEPLAQYLAANFALPVNINSASVSELSAIPGLNGETAAAIVAHREKNGRFASVQDLKKVAGFSDALVAKIANRVTVGIQPR
ncbi:MAG: uptake protein and related DNA-binding protein-like protein [Bryobacterales bacterium]|nr:uptake protein and related DNA-binding protein-like protein [Bryobacterales bacterium]